MLSQAFSQYALCQELKRKINYLFCHLVIGTVSPFLSFASIYPFNLSQAANLVGKVGACFHSCLSLKLCLLNLYRCFNGKNQWWPRKLYFLPWSSHSEWVLKPQHRHANFLLVFQLKWHTISRKSINNPSKAAHI